jgi:hypothetical protein
MCGVALLFVACSYSGYVTVSQHSLGDKIRISVTDWILSFVSFIYISHYSIIEPELVYWCGRSNKTAPPGIRG